MISPNSVGFSKLAKNEALYTFQGVIDFPLPPHAQHVSTAFNPTYSPLPPHSGHTPNTNTNRSSEGCSWSAVRLSTFKPGTVAASR
jgi:hypothetical protein